MARTTLLRSPRFADLVLRTLPGDCLIVLAFHRVGDDLPSWHFGTTPDALERTVTSFARAASPISIRELGPEPVEGRRLAITFDDGFGDNAEVAAPLLERLGVPAVFFLSSGCVEQGVAPWPDQAYARLARLDQARLARLGGRLGPGRPVDTRLSAAHAVVHGMKALDPVRRERLLDALPQSGGEEGRPMTWDQARSLAARGFDLGSHGHTHAILTTLDDASLAFELAESKHLIESRLSITCDALAYPDDRVDERVASAAAAAGYRLGFNGGTGVNLGPAVTLTVQRASGEDPRVGAVALRLRKRRREGAAFAERPATVVWLSPAMPPRTTFLDRELEGLQRLGVPVEPVAPRIGVGAARTFVRRPFASLRVAFRIQELKAPLDRERGRLGYVALTLKGMTLADSLARSRARVHATFADGVGTVAYCASELARAPYTFTAHSPYSLWQRSRLLAEQARAAERVFCVSEDIARRLGELAPGSRRTVVRCLGPSSAPARRASGERPHLLAVGRPLPLKGFSTAIDGFALAVARGADLRLEVIGDGPERAGLEERASRQGVADRVSFPGWVDNELVLERLASALALLAPSEVQPDGDRDGLPVSILDAAACEVSAIATAVSGIPEFVLDGETGLIVPEHDPEALAAAILRLAGDPALVLRLGEAAGKRLAARHDPGRELSKLARVWFPGGARRASDR